MDESLIEAYNYDTFVQEKFERWMTFDQSPALGQPAPDFPLTTLEGEVVQLSDIWRGATYTIIEFGSLT